MGLDAVSQMGYAFDYNQFCLFHYKDVRFGYLLESSMPGDSKELLCLYFRASVMINDQLFLSKCSLAGLPEPFYKY